MTDVRPRELACRKCGAPAGERCRPVWFWIGVHLERLVDAGGKPNVR